MRFVNRYFAITYNGKWGKYVEPTITNSYSICIIVYIISKCAFLPCLELSYSSFNEKVSTALKEKSF